MGDRDYTVNIDMWMVYGTRIHHMMKTFNENVVQHIWRDKSEPLLFTKEDFDNLEYKYDIPLYQKMIFRLRSCKGSAICFWNQIDPSNRHMMLSAYNILDIHYMNDQILNFTFWLVQQNGDIITNLQYMNKDFIEDSMKRYNEYVNRI